MSILNYAVGQIEVNFHKVVLVYPWFHIEPPKGLGMPFDLPTLHKITVSA